MTNIRAAHNMCRAAMSGGEKERPLTLGATDKHGIFSGKPKIIKGFPKAFLKFSGEMSMNINCTNDVEVEKISLWVVFK